MNRQENYESIRQFARKALEDKEQWGRFRREMQQEYFLRWLASEKTSDGIAEREDIFKEFQGFETFCAKLEVLSAQYSKKRERSG